MKQFDTTQVFFKGDVPAWPMEMYCIVPTCTLSVQIVVGQGPVYTEIKSKLRCNIHYSSTATEKNKSSYLLTRLVLYLS